MSSARRLRWYKTASIGLLGISFASIALVVMDELLELLEFDDVYSKQSWVISWWWNITMLVDGSWTSGNL